MKILKGNYGECRFCDNMNLKYGLPSLKEKSWDLCLTDPPYNCSVTRIDKINYKDEWNESDYMAFCKTWFESAFRCSMHLIFTCGVPNEWYYPRPNWVDCWFHAGSTTHTKMGGFSYWQPLLIYSDKIIRDVDALSLPDIKNHFFDQKNHPTLKPIKLWKWEIIRFNAQSVLDPFLGSGTTAQCCEEMGIPWFGYEIMEEYAPDIEKRIQLGIKAHESYKRLKKKQKVLFK
jgi:DNA modification methylase